MHWWPNDRLFIQASTQCQLSLLLLAAVTMLLSVWVSCLSSTIIITVNSFLFLHKIYISAASSFVRVWLGLGFCLLQLRLSLVTKISQE